MFALLTAPISFRHVGETVTVPAGAVCQIAEGPLPGGYVYLYVPWTVDQGMPASQGARFVVGPSSWTPMGHRGRPVAVLNTSILPSGADLAAVAVTVDADIARRLAATGIRSHVGHESTAAIASTLLGVPVAMDRTPWAPLDAPLAIVVQLRGRPPEGVILSAEEIEAIGYDVRLLLTAESVRALVQYVGDITAPVQASPHAADPAEEYARVTAQEARLSWARTSDRLAADVFGALIVRVES